MALLFSIPNLIYSGNPFLINRLHEIVDENNNNITRKTIMNVKYWYSSMPEECKKILQAVIDNDVFSVRKGTFLRVSPTEAYKRGLPHRNDGYVPIGVQGFSVHNPRVAKSYSEALNDANLLSPTCEAGDEFSLVDSKNDFVFRITTKNVSLIDPVGNDIVVLNECEQHALIIYGAIRGLQIVQENIKAWEVRKFQSNMKDKIIQTYGKEQ